MWTYRVFRGEEFLGEITADDQVEALEAARRDRPEANRVVLKYDGVPAQGPF